MLAQRTTLPAPIGGWNARDAQDLMGPTDAIFLDNYFPGDTEVVLRNGFSSHGTGLSDPVNSLFSYDGAGTKKLFAAAGTTIFDATSAGAASSAVTGLTDSKWGGFNLATSGGNFLWVFNETANDAPRHYNGSTWATPTITGITTSNVVGGMLHKRRIFMLLNNSLEFAYLGVNDVAGAASTFDLSSLFAMGGYLQGCGTWTRDGGSGADDLAVFITSNGEVAVYSGSDPSSDWALVGIFKIARPVSRRCVLKVGSDLIVTTEAGAVPLSQVLSSAESAPSTTITDKISGAFRDAARLHGTRFGWTSLLYPRGKYGMFNIPISSGGDFHQYVVNLTTGAWCRFKGQCGYSWIVHDGDLYFGGSGEVFKADDGTNDDGAAIEGYGKTAFNYFDSRGIKKQFTMARPVFESNGALPVSIGFDVDFRDGVNVYTPSAVSTDGSAWDAATWDSADWASEAAPIQAWRNIQGIGYNGALRVKTSTTNQTVVWRAAEVMWKPAVGL